MGLPQPIGHEFAGDERRVFDDLLRQGGRQAEPADESPHGAGSRRARSQGDLGARTRPARGWLFGHDASPPERPIVSMERRSASPIRTGPSGAHAGAFGPESEATTFCLRHGCERPRTE
jgi:hypothetical protein